MKKVIAIFTLIAAAAFGQGNTDRDLFMTPSGKMYSSAGGSYRDVSQELSIARTNSYLIKSFVDLTNYAAGVTGSVVYLRDSASYEFNGFVTNPLSIRVGVSNILFGNSWANDILYYTGTNSALISSNDNITFRTFTVSSTNGIGLSIHNTNSSLVSIENMAFADNQTCLDLNGVYRLRIAGSIFRDFIGTEAAYLYGAGHELFLFDNIFEAENAGTVTNVNLAGTWDVIDISRNYFDMHTQDVAIAGIANNGNIDTGGGLLQGNFFRLSGGVVLPHTNYITGLSHGDTDWEWNSNFGADDSAAAGGLALTNDTIMPILAKDTWTVVTNDLLPYAKEERFTTASNTLTYTGNREIPVTAVLTINWEPDTGNNQALVFAVSVNGVRNGFLRTQGETGAGTAVNSITTWFLEVDTGDNITLEVMNTTSSRDVLFHNVRLVLKE